MTASWQQQLDSAARSASCDFLSLLGNAAPYMGPAALAGGPVLKGAALAAGIANLVTRDGCSWDPEKETELPLTSAGPTGCKKANSNCLSGVVYNTAGTGYRPLFNFAAEVLSFNVKHTVNPGSDPTSYTEEWNATWLLQDGEPRSDEGTNQVSATAIGESAVIPIGCECVEDLPEPEKTIDYGAIPPHTYTDESTGCTLIVETLGFASGPAGVIDPVYRITPGDESGRKRENGGGIIGGCNFSPTIYYQPGGGGGCGGGCPPYPPIPDPGPGDDGPDYWQDLINDFIGGLVGNIVGEAILDYFDQPYEGTTYRLVSACQVDADGEPISQAVEVPIPSLKNLDAVLTRVDALTELMQGLKDFRQPICYVKPADGDARTISFVSEEKSPNGNDYLRKRFSYRSKSGKDLGQVIDHWKSFQFDAGSVVVGHSGSSLGTTQVWASSVNEGKRVIRHAAAEAGVNPDQDGEWRIGSSNSARTGLSGRMRVNTKGGYWWITDRKGASMRPIVGYVSLSDL